MALQNVSDEERAVPVPLELSRTRSTHRLGISMTCFKVQNADMRIMESLLFLPQSVTYSSTSFEMTTVKTTVSLFKPPPTSNKIIQESKEFIQFKVNVRVCPDFNIKLRENCLIKHFLPLLHPGT